jgi:hypothetical protein
MLVWTGGARVSGALLQAVHQLAGDRHAGRRDVAGQRFGDVEGLAVGAAEGAVVQVMVVGTVQDPVVGPRVEALELRLAEVCQAWAKAVAVAPLNVLGMVIVDDRTIEVSRETRLVRNAQLSTQLRHHAGRDIRGSRQKRAQKAPRAKQQGRPKRRSSSQRRGMSTRSASSR